MLRAPVYIKTQASRPSWPTLCLPTKVGKSMPWFRLFFSVIAAVLGISLLLVPPDLLPYVAGSGVLLIVALLSLARPILLLPLIILSSAAGEGLREFQRLGFGESEVTLSGFRWGIIGLLTAFVILANIRRVPLPWQFLSFGVFCFWVAFRWVTASFDILGLKEILFYTLPPFIGLYAIFAALRGGERVINRTETILLVSGLIPLLLYAVYIPLGLTPYTEVGPKGLTNPRPIALYLLVVLSLSLAVWRYGRTPAWSRRGFWLTVIAIVTIFFTLSRTASVAALLLMAISQMNPRRLWSAVPRSAIGAVLAAIILVTVPVYRERSFFNTGGSLSERIEYFNTSGRRVIWPATFDHAMEKPVLGWGPGTSKVLLANLFFRERAEVLPPHNEYLRVFHDTGGVGLFLMLLAWGGLVLAHWRNWKLAHITGDLFRARWNQAAFLGLVMILVTAVTDNTLNYAQTCGPVFILVGFAHYSNRRSTNGNRKVLSASVRENTHDKI